MSKRKISNLLPTVGLREIADRGESFALKNHDYLAELLKNKGFVVEHIAPSSWIALARNFLPFDSDEEFDSLWAQHPTNFKKIKMFGKDVEIPRYQQAYGKSYRFSGTESHAIVETPLIDKLQRELNALIRLDDEEGTPNISFEFNMCLCNWYEPDHYIGPHSDDTRQLVPKSPIAGLSWGATRVFTLTAKKSKNKSSVAGNVVATKRITMNSGDVIVMGGDCQETYKHEIEKLKKGEARDNRVSFTFRCFKK